MEEANLIWRYQINNIILPWYTKSCLEWLLKEDTKSWNVFEYGAGYSTIWWRLNSRSVRSVESNKEWAVAIAINVTFQTEQIAYCAEIGRIEEIFDCIIVDGEWRDDCVEWAIPYLKPKGIIIIDNYEQPSYTETDFKKTNELLKGWTKLIFKQYNHSDWQTAVFIKPE